MLVASIDEWYIFIIKKVIESWHFLMVVFRMEHVSVEVDQKKLLDDISFTLEQGEVMALVGHNGAGKSTLLKTIMAMVEKKMGTIVLEETYHQEKHLLLFKERIAFLPEEPMLLPELTVRQHFQLYAMSYQIDEATFQQTVTEYINGFDLSNALEQYPDELSKGMRQKTQAICSLLPQVSVLLIDEPFMGLDIYAQQYMIEQIERKRNDGTAIILTTHQLDLLKGIAQQFILLQEGKIVDVGKIDQFDTITRRTDNG